MFQDLFAVISGRAVWDLRFRHRIQLRMDLDKARAALDAALLGMRDQRAAVDAAGARLVGVRRDLIASLAAYRVARTALDKAEEDAKISQLRTRVADLEKELGEG